jgi:hypothetical protein
MPNWKKVVLSGSNAAFNSITASNLPDGDGSEQLVALGPGGSFVSIGQGSLSSVVDGDWKEFPSYLTSSKGVIITGSISASGEARFLEGGVTITEAGESSAEIFVDGHITASGAISASGQLFASLSLNDTTHLKTVVYNSSSGQFFFTGSYGGGGGGASNPFITISVDNNPSSAPNPEQSEEGILNGLQFQAGPNITISQSAFGIIEISGSSGAGTPGGLDHYVQYNNDGAFGGRKDFKFYDGANDGAVRVGTQETQNITGQAAAEANLYSGSHVLQGSQPLMTNANIPVFNSTVVFTGFGHKHQITTDDGENYNVANIESMLSAPLNLDDYGTPTSGISAFSGMPGNTIAGANFLTHIYAVIKQAGTALYAHQFTTIPGSPSITIDGNGITIIPSASAVFDITGSSTQGTGSLITPIASASGRITITEASDPANSTFDIIGRKDTFYKTGESGSEENYMIYDNSLDIIGLGGKGLTAQNIDDNKDSATKVYFHDPLTANSAVHFKQDVNFTPSIVRQAEGTSRNTLYLAGNLGNTAGTLASHPNNKQRYTSKFSYNLEGGGNPSGGGGGTGRPFVNVEDSDLQIAIKQSGSENVKGGILFTPNPNIFFFNETNASASISGGLIPDSASAQIKFDTGSSALKFFAGSTNETLKEVLHVSKSGDNPRIGIGISNPIKAFDFKEVRDDDRGGELLIRGSRTTRGADVGDEVGRINFSIDSASFGKVDVSGSAAEIVSIVEDVDATGIQGSLSLRVSDRKSFAPDEILKIKSTGIETTGRIDATSVISGSTLRASGDANIGDWLYAGAISIGNAVDPGPNNLQVNGNINVIGNSTLGNGSSDTVTIAGNITASGNISSSGNLIVDEITTTSNVDIGGVLTLPGFSNVSASLAAAVAGGDNLGNHTATTTLDLDGNNIKDALHITASGNISASGRLLVGSRIDLNGVDSVVNNSGTLIFGNVANVVQVRSSDPVSINRITVANITASSDISASGTIIGSNLSGTNTGDQDLSSYIQASQTSSFLTEISSGIISSSAQFGSSDNVTFGTIEATSLNVTNITSSIVTSSILFTEGSNIFGDTTADTHQFTGSVDISGSLRVNIDGAYKSNFVFHDDVPANGEIPTFVNSNGTLEGQESFTLLSGDLKFDPQGYSSGLFLASAQGNKIELNASNSISIPLASITASNNISSSGTITANSLVGSHTLTTAAQPNVTSLGTLTALTVDQINLDGNSISSTVDSNVDINLSNQGVSFSASPGDSFKFNVDNQDEIDFQVAGGSDLNAIFVKSDNDNVGIGTNTPTKKLTVTGDISASGQLLGAGAGPTINTILASNSATNIDTFNTSSNNGAIYDYTLFSAPSGARAGQCMVIHHNGNTDFTDTSTPTLGSETSIPFFETAVNGANVEVKIASGSGYTFKAFVKKL